VGTFATEGCFTRPLAWRYTGPSMTTRRTFLQTAASASAAFTLTTAPHRLLAQANAVYRNPILGGDHPDASPIRVGNEFFLTHSSFDYAPGLLIWRSADLVNWRPVAAALHRYAGSVWAPYLCEYEGRFYIYFPAITDCAWSMPNIRWAPGATPSIWASTPSIPPTSPRTGAASSTPTAA